MSRHMISYIMNISEDRANKLAYGVADKIDKLTGQASTRELSLMQVGYLLDLIMFRLEKLEEECHS